MTSERPEGLNPMEMEEYELAIEEQAYPFEEQAIAFTKTISN
jgi:cellulose synthase operon protein C